MKALFAAIVACAAFFSPMTAHEFLVVPLDETWKLCGCGEEGKTEYWTRGEERVTLMTFPLEERVTMDQVLHFATELMYNVDLQIHEKGPSEALISALTEGKAFLVCKMILGADTIHLVHYSFLGNTALVDCEGAFSLIKNTYSRDIL
jgi:hypothetical protein